MPTVIVNGYFNVGIKVQGTPSFCKPFLHPFFPLTRISHFTIILKSDVAHTTVDRFREPAVAPLAFFA